MNQQLSLLVELQNADSRLLLKKAELDKIPARIARTEKILDSARAAEKDFKHRLEELNKKIAEVKDYEKRNQIFLERKKIIEELRANQSLPVKVLDESCLEPYGETAGPLVAEYGGEYLARSANPEAVEGTWPSDRDTVIMRWPSREAFKAFWDSPGYAKAKEIRRWADQLVTLAKKGDLHARRQAISRTAGEQNVVKVALQQVRRHPRRLLIGGRGENQFQHVLHRPTAVHEFHRQPVQ